MTTNKKYQHFVPKFYLRFFSDDKKSVGTYILKNKKYIKQASLNSVGGADYLYGKDGTIEDCFSEMEGKWNSIICKIINTEKIDLDLNEYFMLLTFIFFSDARSKQVADSQNEMINYFANVANVLMNNDSFNEYSFDESLAKFNIPNYYPLSVVETVIPLFFDLKLSLLKNNTSSQFITSDCVLVKYNQYLLDNEFYFGYGYAAVGFQCFLPISPKLCLYLFDPAVYKHNEKNHIIQLNRNEDIYQLNKIFTYNSDEYLFFHHSTSENKIKTFLKNNEKQKRKNNSIFKTEDNEYMIMISQKCINKNFNLNFVKFKENYRKKKIFIKSLQPPIRELPKKIMNDKENLPEEVLNKLEGKIFHLEK